MSPGRIFALVLAALIVVGALLRRRRLGNERFALALLAAAALTVYGSHVLAHVDIQKGIENLANALGKWTYALVGAMAFLETGAFVGLVAPGEFTVLLGGVIAGQGEIDIWVLIPLVWACTLAGDSISFFLGRRLGRNFLLKHGPKVRITPERLAQVDEHFRRRGGGHRAGGAVHRLCPPDCALHRRYDATALPALPALQRGGHRHLGTGSVRDRLRLVSLVLEGLEDRRAGHAGVRCIGRAGRRHRLRAEAAEES